MSIALTPVHQHRTPTAQQQQGGDERPGTGNGSSPSPGPPLRGNMERHAVVPDAGRPGAVLRPSAPPGARTPRAVPRAGPEGGRMNLRLFALGSLLLLFPAGALRPQEESPFPR